MPQVFRGNTDDDPANLTRLRSQHRGFRQNPSVFAPHTTARRNAPQAIIYSAQSHRNALHWQVVTLLHPQNSPWNRALFQSSAMSWGNGCVARSGGSHTDRSRAFRNANGALSAHVQPIPAMVALHKLTCIIHPDQMQPPIVKQRLHLRVSP